MNIEIRTEEWTNKRDLNGILDTFLGQKHLVMLVTVELNVDSSYYWCFSRMCSLLKPKINLKHLKSLFVPRSKHSPSRL